MKNHNHLTEFAEKLIDALKAKGYRVIPKIDNLAELESRYRNFSSSEMAKQFEKEFNMEKITIIYELLNRINNLENYSISEFAKKLKINARALALAIKLFPRLESDGRSRAKNYYYVSTEPLSMKAAQELYDLILKIINVKVTRKEKNDIEKYVKEGKSFQEFKEDKISEPYREYFLQNQFHGRKSLEKMKQEKLKNKGKKIITEAKFIVPQNGHSVEEKTEIRTEVTSEIKKEVKETTGLEILAEGLKMQLELYRHKISYLETQVQGQEKFIGYLMKRIENENSAVFKQKEPETENHWNELNVSDNNNNLFSNQHSCS